MRKSLEVGLSAALLLTGAACIDDSDDADSLSRYETETTAEVVDEVQLYAQPNDIDNPMVTVAVGEQANVVCYYSSATLAMDSVRLIIGGGENGGEIGFGFIGHRNPDGSYVADFEPDLQGGDGIRDCKRGQDFAQE